MHEVTVKLRCYQICLSNIDRESFDQVVKESEKAIMMSEVNEKLNPVELSPLKHRPASRNMLRRGT